MGDAELVDPPSLRLRWARRATGFENLCIVKAKVAELVDPDFIGAGAQ